MITLMRVVFCLLTLAVLPSAFAQGKILSEHMRAYQPELIKPPGLTDQQALKWKEKMEAFLKSSTVPIAQKTKVFVTSLPQSSGQAVWKGAENACHLYIDPEAVFKHWGATTESARELSFNFVMLHELGHCVFYQNNELNWPNADTYSGHLLNMLLELDAWIPVEDRPNLFALSHENYADLFAIGQLLSMGYKAKDMAPFAAVRGQNPFSTNHQTESAIDQFLGHYHAELGSARDSHSVSDCKLDQMARTVVGKALSKQFNFGMIYNMSLEEKQRYLVGSMALNRQMYWAEQDSAKEIGVRLGWLGTDPHLVHGAPFARLKPWFFTSAVSLKEEDLREEARSFVDRTSNKQPEACSK